MFIDAILKANFILIKTCEVPVKHWHESSSASMIQVVKNSSCNLFNKEILELKSMSMTKDSIINVLPAIRMRAFQANRNLCVCMAIRIVELTLIHGSSKFSCVGKKCNAAVINSFRQLICNMHYLGFSMLASFMVIDYESKCWVIILL